jgi:hypothetical protein
MVSACRDNSHFGARVRARIRPWRSLRTITKDTIERLANNGANAFTNCLVPPSRVFPRNACDVSNDGKGSRFQIAATNGVVGDNNVASDVFVTHAIERAKQLSKFAHTKMRNFRTERGRDCVLAVRKALILHSQSLLSDPASTSTSRATLVLAPRARNKRSCRSYRLAQRRSETRASGLRNLRDAKRPEADRSAVVSPQSAADHGAFR